MAQLVICIASSEEQAAGITNKLKSEDFSKDDISVLFSDKSEGKVKEGNILISVHTYNKDEQDTAKKIFKESGADEIATTGESSMSSELGQNQQKDSTISTTDPKDPEVPGKEEPRV